MRYYWYDDDCYLSVQAYWLCIYRSFLTTRVHSWSYLKTSFFYMFDLIWLACCASLHGLETSGLRPSEIFPSEISPCFHIMEPRMTWWSGCFLFNIRISFLTWVLPIPTQRIPKISLSPPQKYGFVWKWKTPFHPLVNNYFHNHLQNLGVIPLYPILRHTYFQSLTGFIYCWYLNPYCWWLSSWVTICDG